MHDTTAPLLQTPGPLVWSDRLQLGFGPMDSVHEEFVACLAALREATPAGVPGALDAMIAHLEHHFGEEDGWMKETAFPPRDCHIDEHAAVLASARGVRDLLAEGNDEPLGRFVDALEEWFPGHATHLDSALAHWMCKQRFGGKPVVIRRAIR